MAVHSCLLCIAEDQVKARYDALDAHFRKNIPDWHRAITVEESVSHQLLAFFDEVGLEESGQFVNRVEYSN